MRHFISILLLSILLANFGGSYVYFAFRALQIKQHMRALLATLPEEELELIVLTPEEFKRSHVEEHEIKVNGNMFDIARIIEKDSKLFVYGVYDDDEDNLLSFLNAVVNNLDNDTNPVPPGVVLFCVWHALHPQFHFVADQPAVQLKYFTAYHAVAYLFNLPIESPPPKGYPLLPV